MWRKRVGVEPTILAAEDRINGFEGHEGHRTPFASQISYSETPDYISRGQMKMAIAAQVGPAVANRSQVNLESGETNCE